VKFIEDSRIKVVREDKSWKLRENDDDETEVDFNSVCKGDQFLAYWTPNRRYYEATVISTSSPDNCNHDRVKRKLSLDGDELNEMSTTPKMTKTKKVKEGAVFDRSNRETYQVNIIQEAH
jgi:hypothetical protein